MSNPAILSIIESAAQTRHSNAVLPQPLSDEHKVPDDRLRDFRHIVQHGTLRPVFQPIVDVRNELIYGYEALIRGPENSSLVSPFDLFRCAMRLSMEDEFEVLCRKLSIQQFVRGKLPHRLFLNTSPSLLIAGDFKKGKTLQFLREFHLDPRNVVIEVTEQQQTCEYSILNEALQQYRALGFQVALDDLGAGYSSLRLWNEVTPDFIKVDKHFIRDIHLNKLKQSFLKGLLEMSAGTNCRLIAEGIEKKAEFEYLHSLGITLMQGYYFAKPVSDPPAEIARELFVVAARPEPITHKGQDNLLAITKRVEPIPFNIKVKDVLEMIQKDSELDLIPVVNSARAVGLVERYTFMNKILKSIYGVSLYGKLRIVDFLDHEPVVVDLSTNLDVVSQKITSQSHRFHGFVVTDNGQYHGVSTVLDLLQRITQQQINSARHANPLTLLPGVVPTNDGINSLLAAQKRFALVYFDLDNFKPYNDQYGYEAGDGVLKRFAELLQTVYPAETTTIGHIGGDDFVVIDQSDKVVENCQRMFETSTREVPTFYRAEHVQAGGIGGVDRQNRPCFYPLLSVSAGVVPPECTASCHSHIELADYAAEAKKLAKRKEGNSCFVNRRSSGS